MKTVLPGAVIGLFGGGENSRMFAMVAHRMGYRVHVYSRNSDSLDSLAGVTVTAPYEDLDRVRDFASAVDIVTVAESNVPLITLEAAARCASLHPSASVFEAIENGIGAKVDPAADNLAEFSVIGARGAGGQSVFYPPIAIDRVLDRVDIARSPAPIRARIARQAAALTRDMMEDLDLTGILCVEFVLAGHDSLLVRDATPHPHRSGYLTLDACVTSQFEQQLRAVCGLPLGSTQLLRPAAMAVLTEQVWENGTPDWSSAYQHSQVKLHLYGNRGGHLTATADSATLAQQIVRTARAGLTRV